MPQDMKEIFYNLEGTWSIERTITDKWQGQDYLEDIGNAEGLASFTKSDPNILNYYEELKINLKNSPPKDGYQKYQFCYDDEQNLVRKYNSSGDLMYELNGEDGICGTYLCGQDRYVATYDFATSKSFRLTYEIDGPTEHYLIITEFTKIEDTPLVADMQQVGDGND